MRITKLGHSCLLVEEKDVRTLVDPGVWSTIPDDLGMIDMILITHEHPDHLDIPNLKKVLSQSPETVVYTNSGVGAKLQEENIAFALLEHEQATTIHGVSVMGIGKKHAVIYPELPVWDNTGYLIADRLFVTGDALTLPERPVEILALPVCAPWSKIMEVIDYAKEVKPKIAFPVHDGMLKIMTGFHKWPGTFLPPAGIEWKIIEDGQTIDV